MLEQFAYSPFSPLTWTLGFEVLRLTILSSIATKLLSRWTNKSISYRESLFAVIVFRLSALIQMFLPPSLTLFSMFFSLVALVLIIHFWTKKYTLSFFKKTILLLSILISHLILLFVLFVLAMMWQSIFFDMDFYMNNINDPNMMVIN